MKKDVFLEHFNKTLLYLTLCEFMTLFGPLVTCDPTPGWCQDKVWVLRREKVSYVFFLLFKGVDLHMWEMLQNNHTNINTVNSYTVSHVLWGTGLY